MEIFTRIMAIAIIIINLFIIALVTTAACRVFKDDKHEKKSVLTAASLVYIPSVLGILMAIITLCVL